MSQNDPEPGANCWIWEWEIDCPEFVRAVVDRRVVRRRGCVSTRVGIRVLLVVFESVLKMLEDQGVGQGLRVHCDLIEAGGQADWIANIDGEFLEGRDLCRDVDDGLHIRGGNAIDSQRHLTRRGIEHGGDVVPACANG